MTRFIPVPQEKIECIRPLLDRARIEMNMAGRSNVDIFIQRLHASYEARHGAVYVDSLESPKHCVVLMHWPGFVTVGTLVAVVLVYSLPEHRKGMGAAKGMHQAIEAFANSVGAQRIIGSSWVFKGARPIDSFWTSGGYELQEKTYVKDLDDDLQ